MKLICIFLFTLVMNSLYGQLDADGCSGIIGDVKYSILDPADFQSVNGDCWILMDGRNISSSKLATDLSTPNIPDARGYFVRSYDNRISNRVDIDRSFGDPVGSIQADTLKSHKHDIVSGGNHEHIYNDFYDGPSGFIRTLSDGYDNGDSSGTRRKTREASTGGGSHSHDMNNTGGTETRPKNITLYLYVRIN